MNEVYSWPSFIVFLIVRNLILFWEFFHIENDEYTHVACLFLSTHSYYDRYSLSSNNCELILGVLPPFRKKLKHIYHVCFCQDILATIDIHFRATISTESCEQGFKRLNQ